MRPRSWKRIENKVARKLGGRRNPLSGRNSGHGTSADVLLDGNEYVEVKSRKRMAVFGLFRQVREKARKERKVPVLVLHETGKPLYLKVTELEERNRPPDAQN